MLLRIHGEDGSVDWSGWRRRRGRKPGSGRGNARPTRQLPGHSRAQGRHQVQPDRPQQVGHQESVLSWSAAIFAICTMCTYKGTRSASAVWFNLFKAVLWICLFGPPGSRSGSQMYRSESFFHQAVKPWFPLYCDFFMTFYLRKIMKMYLQKVIIRKTLKKIVFRWRLEDQGWKWYTHKTSGFKTSGIKMSGFKTSETSGLQNVRFTKCHVYKMSGLQNVRSSKRLVAKKLLYIYSVLLVDGNPQVLLQPCLQAKWWLCFILYFRGVFLPYITIMATNK